MTSTEPSQPAGEIASKMTRQRLEELSRAGSTRPTIPAMAREDAQTMSAIFARMKSIYGHLWSSNFKDETQLRIAQSEWLAAIRRASLTRENVSRALDWMTTHQPDMPNLPGFIDICKMQRRYQAPPQLITQQKTPEQKAADDAAARAFFEAHCRQGRQASAD